MRSYSLYHHACTDELPDLRGTLNRWINALVVTFSVVLALLV